MSQFPGETSQCPRQNKVSPLVQGQLHKSILYVSMQSTQAPSRCLLFPAVARLQATFSLKFRLFCKFRRIGFSLNKVIKQYYYLLNIVSTETRRGRLIDPRPSLIQFHQETKFNLLTKGLNFFKIMLHSFNNSFNILQSFITFNSPQKQHTLNCQPRL